MLQLMKPTPALPAEHPLLSYEYHESDRWTTNEINAFYQSLLKYNKDFPEISRDIGTKSAKQCVQFYYLWKRLCPEEYARLQSHYGKTRVKLEVRNRDSKDSKELRGAIATVAEFGFGEEKSILHRTLVSSPSATTGHDCIQPNHVHFEVADQRARKLGDPDDQ